MKYDILTYSTKINGPGTDVNVHKIIHNSTLNMTCNAENINFIITETYLIRVFHLNSNI